MGVTAGAGPWAPVRFGTESWGRGLDIGRLRIGWVPRDWADSSMGRPEKRRTVWLRLSKIEYYLVDNVLITVIFREAFRLPEGVAAQWVAQGRDSSRSDPYDSRSEFRHHSAAQGAPQEIWHEGIYSWRFGGALPGSPGGSPRASR
jgi:hypothetical protein